MSENTKTYEIEATGYWNYSATIEVEDGEDPLDVAFDMAMMEAPPDVELDEVSVSTC